MSDRLATTTAAAPREAAAPPGPRVAGGTSEGAYAALDAVRDRIFALEFDNYHLAAALAAAKAETRAARAEIDTLRGAATRTQQDLARTIGEFERGIDEMREEYAGALAEQARRCTALPLDGLLTAFAEMQRAATPAALLDTVVQALAREFSRVALFSPRGDNFEAASHVGFELAANVRRLTRGEGATLVARAATSGGMEVVVPDGDDEAAGILPFGGTPTCAVAIPFRAGTATLAVIYADDSDVPGFAASPSPARVKYAELLRQHAQLLVEALERRDREPARWPSAG